MNPVIPRFFARGIRNVRPQRPTLVAIPVLGVLVLMILWGVIFTRLSIEKDSAEREASSSAAILSAALEQNTIKSIHQIDQVTRFVKYEFEKNPNHSHHFSLNNAINKNIVPNGTLARVSIINEHGTLIESTTHEKSPHIDVLNQSHFIAHADHNNDQLYIGKPTLGRVSGQWTLSITRRLEHPDGSFAGVVAVTENPDYFTRDFYNRAIIGKNGVIAVIADNGTVLARRTGHPQSRIGTFAATEVYPVADLKSGTYADPLDGVMRFMSYRHLNGYPLGVLVGLSHAEELADYRHTRNIYISMAGFISLALVCFFIVATHLISKLLGREQAMTHLVEYDLLTGLHNRYATLRTLREDLQETTNVGRLALLFIDLDNFKTVNDTLGHNAGDMVLQMTASRLAHVIGHDGVLSRIGGDEFLVVLKGDNIEQRATRLADKVHISLEQPFEIRNAPFILQTSIGIALHATADETEIDLLKKADLAMYSAKEAGKNCYRFYAPHLSHRADHLMKWEQQLHIALAENQLFLVYQPIIDLPRRCITGFEALVRWKHPQHGIISASEFIPVAESTGLIVPIGEFVVQSACRQLATWRGGIYENLSLSVNISAMQFWRGNLYETVLQAIQETGAAANRLELEITETATIEYPDLVSEKITALKRLGIRIALDDFGTGYSSLSYLNRFAVDTLKIDRSFIQVIPDDRGVCVMVSAIVNLARSLGLKVIAEGIETDQQVAWLTALGPIEAQGFLFSRPVAAQHIAALLEQFGVCLSRATSEPHATSIGA